MRKKLYNSKGYAESPEFLPALGLFTFKKKSVATTYLRGKRSYKRLSTAVSSEVISMFL